MPMTAQAQISETVVSEAVVSEAVATEALATEALATEAITAVAISNDNRNNTINNVPKTDVHAKYYQQALYYYFQGNYSGALDIINQSKSRLNSIEPTTQLFEAGLQVKIGLQEEAKQNLILLSTKPIKTTSALNKPSTLNKDEELESQAKNKAYKVSSDQLLVLALLSLSEQYIEQGDVEQAQQTLAKMSNVPTHYYQQYHVLNQLAYWPEQPNLTNVVDSSPYIQLNNALRFIEAGKFDRAIPLLDRLKNRSWQKSEQSFFQSLFSEDVSITLDKQQEDIQNQAITDYARLLLAHLYTQQEAYEKVYVELKAFPQESNHTESALFLYAFSAQKIKQYTIALTLLSLLHEQYPHSALGWQAGLLMANQVTEQQGLGLGWKSYQNVESFYLNTIEQLNAFEQSFEQSFASSADLLIFSTEKPPLKDKLDHYFKTPIQANPLSSVKAYEPQSIWLKQAMLDPSLNSLYQQLTQVTALLHHSQLLQRKSDLITDIIKLNIKRKIRIAATQQALAQQNTYANLFKQRESLAVTLSKAMSFHSDLRSNHSPKHSPNHSPNHSSNIQEQQLMGSIFANEEEQAWLERLNKSKESLAYIANPSFIIEHSQENQQQINADYQQRLNRLNGVLVWRLAQAFPQRAWDHKQQLDELDHNLQKLGDLQTNVTQLLTESASEYSQSSLAPFIKRQKIEAAKIEPLITKLETLKEKTSLKIREKVAYYSSTQRSILAQHLLTTRKAMALVLENMSVNDDKIEKQLNSDEEVIKQQVSNEQVVKDQPIKTQTINDQAFDDQVSREQAIKDRRMKTQAIKALRKALSKKKPSIKNKSVTQQNNKEQAL